MLTSHDNETIIAQATPSGAGALALLRISGNNTLDAVTSMGKLASGTPLNTVDSHTVHYGWVVRQDGSVIDQVMFIVMHAPRTFTGQNVVEITCHNNPFIIEAIIERAIACGIRMAQHGEFSKRAVLHGKIDLVKAEAINELIHANTHMALKASLAQLHGSLSAWITQIEKELLKALAFSEASFEFIDEEMTFDTQIITSITHVQEALAKLKNTFALQQQVRQGVRIALLGSVNAGKSSLFNALLGTQRAIVTAIAGTTRDSIEAGIYKGNSYITLIDTAGLRQTLDVIEQEGIARSLQEAGLADIVLLVIDQSRIMTAQEKAAYQELIAAYKDKIIVVYTKADLHKLEECSNDIPALAVASTTGYNIPNLHALLDTKIEQLFQQAQSPFLLNKRQYTLLMRLEQKLVELQNMLAHTIHYELVSYHLIDALAHVSELTGKTISEQGMDAVFKEFCVGK